MVSAAAAVVVAAFAAVAVAAVVVAAAAVVSAAAVCRPDSLRYVTRFQVRIHPNSIQTNSMFFSHCNILLCSYR